MNPTDSTCHLNDRDKQPTRPTACGECPYLKINRGREHDKGTFDDVVFTKTWRGMTHDGMYLGCHKFDADAYPFDEVDAADGYVKPVNVGTRIECAGAAALIRNEFEKMPMYPNHAAYIEDNPTGLQKSALEVYIARMRGELDPPLRFPDRVDRDSVHDPAEVVDQSSIWWMFDEPKAARLIGDMTALMPNLMACDCMLCERHHEVHEMSPLRTPQGEVKVDAPLQPILQAMNDAGITTISSCVDFYQLYEQLMPGRLGEAMNTALAVINHRPALIRRAAFVRFANNSAAAKTFLAGVETIPGVEAVSDGLLSQIVFNEESKPAIRRTAKHIRSSKR
jgi:hypothetical protein